MLYPRDLFDSVWRYRDIPEAVVVTGARQVGKTCLMRLVMEKLGEGSFVYLDLENYRAREIVNRGVEELVSFVDAEVKPKRKYLFIDEIGYADDPSNLIKLLVDHYSFKIKLFITGSSSLRIKKKFRESMTGRKIEFILYPLSFREYLVFKKRDKLASLIPEDPFLQNEDGTRFYEEDYKKLSLEFMIYGGYPRVALAETYEEKRLIIDEIISSYVMRDVRDFFNIEKITKFNRMVKILATLSGKLLNVLNLSKEAGISRKTVEEYLYALKESYIISEVMPFFRNPKKEILKTPKIYFIDPGIRNGLLNNFSMSWERDDIGILMETAVFSGMLKRGIKANFWRTQNGGEIDMVIERDGKIIPVEIKKTPQIRRAMVSFMKKYRCPEGYVVYPGSYFKKENIKFLPLWWFL